MGSEFQKKKPLAGAQCARTAEADGHGMQVDSVFPEMVARIAIAMASLWGHGGVVKGQRRRLDAIFFMTLLGGFAFLPVLLIIRPVRRQNVVPTHWVRE
jgi:hypothetical protein